MDALTRRRPDFDRVRDAALRIVDEFADQPFSIADLERTLHAVLYGPKQGWGCYVDGLLTAVELRDLVASWVIPFALAHRTAPRPTHQISSDASREALLDALFAGQSDSR